MAELVTLLLLLEEKASGLGSLDVSELLVVFICCVDEGSSYVGMDWVLHVEALEMLSATVEERSS